MKNILIFGFTGYIGQNFSNINHDFYNLIPIVRSEFDFLNPNFDKLIHKIDKLSFGIDGILFLQGINPRVGVNEISSNQFQDMLNLNLVVPMQIIQKINLWMNKRASVIFMSSIARKKGSYDPSYASAKSGLEGLQQTLINHFPDIRFNIISLGLVEDSPVHKGMTFDFEKKHLDAMGGKLVQVHDVCNAIEFLIDCDSISGITLPIEGGFKL